MRQHRKPADIIFFNRLWDVYELDIVIQNSMILPLSVQYDTNMSLYDRSQLFRVALDSDRKMREWKERTDQIVSLTEEELHHYTFGDFMSDFMYLDRDDTVACFAWKMSDKDRIGTLKSRSEGNRVLRSEREDWSDEFQKAWDLYLVEHVQRRQDIWSFHQRKHERDQSCDFAISSKRMKKTGR